VGPEQHEVRKVKRRGESEKKENKKRSPRNLFGARGEEDKPIAKELRSMERTGGRNKQGNNVLNRKNMRGNHT